MPLQERRIPGDKVVKTFEDLTALKPLLDDGLELMRDIAWAVASESALPPLCHEYVSNCITKARSEIEFLHRHYFEDLPHQTYLLSAFVIMVNLSSAQSSIEISKALAEFNVPKVKELLGALKATQDQLKPLLRVMLNL